MALENENGMGEIYDIEDDKEYDMILKLFNEFQEEDREND